ncbi:MAG: bifunctional oligoribonuclease/PAP phosphatase NrnA [Candidatus Doudnabacteria bacterium]|nr:bifunctional oligoribonuclease/PAP phosphatase NrnA [Candidatus Doudnabacteria bacterium]
MSKGLAKLFASSTRMMIQDNLKRAFQKAKGFIDQAPSIILASHEYTDGDDLGAILALSHVLEGWSKKTLKLAKGGVPDNLLFLPGHGEVKESLPEDYKNYDLLITVGCGKLTRPGFAELEGWPKTIVNLDHHADTQMFGTVNIWDASLAANCELVYLMLKDWRVAIDKFIALYLLTGIFTDTGGFRHANISALTFEIAAELLRKGAKLDLISRFTFSQKELPMLRAWAAALENARLDPKRQMVYTVITAEDLAAVGAKEEDLEGVVELLNTIPEAKFSMLLKQRGEEIKGSLRSEHYKGVDVAAIARAFGGGGHKLAAGFKFKGKIEKTKEGWKIT